MPRIVSMNVLHPAWHITFGKSAELAENDGGPKQSGEAAKAADSRAPGASKARK